MRTSSLTKYLSTLFSVMPGKTVLALVLMVCLGLTEGVSLLMLVPLLQLVGLQVGEGAMGGIARFLTSIFTAVGIQPTLIAVLGVYILIVCIHGLLYRWQTTANISLEYEFVSSLRKRLYKAIAGTNWLFFSRARSSDFTNVLTFEMERISGATYSLLNLLATTIVTMVYVLFALRLSPLMTVLVFACGAGLMLFLRGKTQISYKAGEDLSKAMASLYAAITEHLGGMKTAKSYGAEGRHAEVFGKLTEEVRHQYVHAVRNQAEVRYWFSTGSVLVLSFILYISIEIVAVPAAEILLLLYLYARIMPKFASLQESYQGFLNLFPSFSSITETQARCEDAAEPEAVSAEKIEFQNSIRFDQVSFGYDKQNGTQVISNLDLTIKAGETTAIVGPSGVGKTTVADLVMGLIVPDQGRVLVDGKPLNPGRVTYWREKIGYVAQDTFLFHDTIRANLLWANPGATEEEINQSLKLAAAGEFVSRLPKELDTIIGDRGVLVSGGEKQRLALARALLRKPSLLILDEATSSLDSENEKRIQEAIEKLHGRMTILVITHRLSTIHEADIIHVLEEGRLVESGTWDELIEKETGRFRELCLAQGIE